MDHPGIEALLAFAARSRTADGFGYLLADGTVDPARPLETWINARMTHVFSLAVLGGRSDLRPLAEHGIAALTGPLHDVEHGGWYAEVGDETKAAYPHAFVLLAAASATQARIAGASDLLADVLHVWDTRFWDSSAGAVLEQWDRGFATLDGYRGANANMHGVEAMLAAADALPSRAAELRQRCLRVVRRFVHDEAGSREWRLPEHFSSLWEADLGYAVDDPADPFRPYGVTVGHQLEWARLAVHVHACLPEAWLLEDARGLYAAAVERGWHADGQDGFVYTLDWQDRPVVAARMHWVLAEGLSAAAVLLRATGEDAYAQDHAAWTRHAARFASDTGSWHHELTPSGEVATGTWSGQPDAYHVFQALLFPSLPLTGSLAESLRERASTR